MGLFEILLQKFSFRLNSAKAFCKPMQTLRIVDGGKKIELSGRFTKRKHEKTFGTKGNGGENDIKTILRHKEEKL